MTEPAFQTDLACPECRTHIAPSLLACPVCHQLVHSEDLKKLAVKADRAESQKNYVAALGLWRESLALLPAESRQYNQVLTRVQSISRHVDAHPTAEGQSESRSWIKGFTGIGTLGLVLWKFKFLLGFMLTKGKLLLLGLTKAGTLWSMLASFALYWSLWGWRFGLGIVASIYVHEMGHVAALRNFGIKASAPTFIPGLGAMVRMHQHPASPMENARVGLAGPLWGTAAALAAYGIYGMTHMAGFAAIARAGAWINLFNLLPIMPLDGGRGFQALARKQRWIAAAAIAAAWWFSGEGLLLLLLIAAAVHAVKKTTSDPPDPVSLCQYVGLVAVLSWMCSIKVPA